MSKPVIRGDAPHRYEKRVPTDLVAKLRGREVFIELPAAASGDSRLVSFTLGQFARVSLHTRDHALSHARCAAVQAHLERVYEAARSGSARLTPMRIEALARQVYEHISRRFLESPGTPDAWAAVKAFTRAALEGRIASAPRLPCDFDPVDEVQLARELFGETMTDVIDSLPPGVHTSALEQRFGAYVDWVLGINGLEIDEGSRSTILERVGVAILNASWRMKRAANFDWSDDPAEGRFPKIDPGEKLREPSSAVAGISFKELLERWAREVNPAASTRDTWQNVAKQLTKYVGHDDITKISKQDIINWKDNRILNGVKAKTLNQSYLSCLRALYNFAITNSLHDDNPAKGVRAGGGNRASDAKLAYEDQEIAKLLDLSSKETLPIRRWVPWLLILTGARAGEICQLWETHVRMIDGIHVISIQETDDGGTIKHSAERYVPIHPALIEAGLLDFVASRKGRPLFYDRLSRGGDDKRHKSKHITARLGRWIRDNGFTDVRKSPLHATRHWFKSVASRIGIQDSIVDAIQGHRDGRAASVYRHIDIKTMAEAVAKIPVPPLDDRREMTPPLENA
ncbi:tyrosine-type recombinase/integrase [Methylobacterium aquaticum]|uniref:tyrosine-type recombinase/integrase n=1 Tax=Methylobacterium aquaticum TaxID=270351 RepID=UPI00193253AB|nr:tyrosine-type recombinase/integrase [Methylobacterium aquaticum]